MKTLAIGFYALLGIAAPAHAAQIVLSESAVIGDSGSFGSQFLATNILDRQTGPISEAFSNGEYWLNPDGRKPAFITIDLGGAYQISNFELFNSVNFGDRATAGFEIYGSNTTAAATGTGASGLTLGSDAKLLVTGTLAIDPSSHSLAGQNFASIDKIQSFRYIQFRPTSAINTSYGGAAYGLNELRVFEHIKTETPVPEPAGFALMLSGLGLAGVTLRKRRQPRVQG